MAIALDNSNARRRNNKIARAIEHGLVASPEAGVTAWIAASGKSISQRPAWMRRTPGARAGELGKSAQGRSGQKARTGDKSAQSMIAHMVTAKQSSPEERAALAHIKREVAHEFKRQDPEGYHGDYVTRLTRGKGRAYRVDKKKQLYSQKHTGMNKAGKPYKLPFGGKRAQFIKKGSEARWKADGFKVKRGKNGTPYVIVEGFDYKVTRAKGRGGIVDWDARRQRNRASNRTGHTYPVGMPEYLDAHGRPWPEVSIRKVPYKSRTKSRARQAQANALALDNPELEGVAAYFTGYALPVVVAGAAGGALHAFTNFGPGQVSARLNDLIGMVPVLGPAVNTWLPNTFTGIIAGGTLALIAARMGPGDARKFLALTGGAALAIGGGMDAYNALSAQLAAGGGIEEEEASLEEDMGALALDNFGGIALDNMGGLALDNMGALALDNMGGIALDNFGDGMAYETAPLAAGQLYGQATLGDAYYSGADFSLGEGQALLNGSQTWVSKFGRPTRRTKRIEGSASHMAGVAGHRWGWLIKIVGFHRAAAIAAMPPRRRLNVLKALRAGAIKGFQQATLQGRARAIQAATPPIEELVAKTAAAGTGQIGPQAANGPCGPGGLEHSLSYGDPALFMGA